MQYFQQPVGQPVTTGCRAPFRCGNRSGHHLRRFAGNRRKLLLGSLGAFVLYVQNFFEWPIRDLSTQ